MEEVKFNLNEIDKTFAKYKKNEIFDGVVILKREDGVIFNIGGKSDAFIDKSDFDNFEDVKIGERFKVCILGNKTEEGMICVSKRIADNIVIGSQTAEKLKIGSEFSFYVTKIENGQLTSKMGIYNIIVPNSEIDTKVRNIKSYLNTQQTGIVTEINKNERLIVCSVKMLKEQKQEAQENLFWNSIFINKIVNGIVKNIVPYGAFIDVDGVTCFIHISDLDYSRVSNVSQYLEVGNSYNFRVIKLDKDNKKVSLGLKQLTENPKTAFLRNLKVGEKFNGTVTKILAFGAIVKLDEGGIEGLLHVSDATEHNDKRIYQIVKLGQKVEVEIKSIDEQRDRVSFKL